MSKTDSSLACKKCGSIDIHADGRCKPCRNSAAAQYRSANPDAVKASSKKYCEKNPTQSKLSSAAWRASNKDAAIASSKAWKLENKEKNKESHSVWISLNREKIKMAQELWHVANPNAKRIHNQNRSARKTMSGSLSSDIADRLIALQKGKCPCCGLPLESDYHLDHKMPLALGGSNTDENMQLLRKKCNLQKSAKHPVDFMQSRGFLL